MQPETSPDYGQSDWAIRELTLVVFIIFAFSILPVLCYIFDQHRRRRRRRYHLPTNTAMATTLDPSLFRFLPPFTYSFRRPTPECAICLSEFEEGDEGRMLPNCNHVFHRRCIDAWFRSHSTCPMCRVPVQPPKISSEKENPEASLSAGFPNLVLPAPIWCPRKPLQKMALVEVIVMIRGEEDDERFRVEGRRSRIEGVEKFGSTDSEIEQKFEQ